MLVHGVGGDRHAWDPILPFLAREREVVAIDVPGYGEAEPLDVEPSVPALTDALEAELDRAGLGASHLVGNSMGGWISAELAARGRARSVIAISPAGLWSRNEWAFAYVSLRLSLAVSRTLAPFAGRLGKSAIARTVLFAQLVGPHGWRMEPDAAAHALRVFAGSPSFRQTIDWVRRERAVVDRLSSVSCPFLIAWGTWDFLLRPRQSRRWGAAIPHAETRLLPRHGHIPMPDRPETIARLISEFADRAEAGPAR